MNKLAEFLSSLPEKIRLAFRFRDVKAPTLEERIQAGVEVTSIVLTPGMQAINEEADKLDKSLLEQIASEETKSWEEYVELRGRLMGFRLRHNLPREIMQEAAKAEAEAERRGLR